jgi:predicted alpha/beta hydrolase
VIPRRLAAADGHLLTLYRARAYRDRRPAVLLVHGAFSNHRVWMGPGSQGGGLAHFLTERGLDVWLADLRHHGASDREPAPGRWRFEDWILRDTPVLVARLQDETDGARLVWLGHSAGGAVGLCWIARGAAPATVAGIVTFGTPGPLRMGPVRLSLAAVTIGVSRALGRFPARLLRLGSEDEAAGILSDWMTWNVRGRWVGADGFDYLAALTRLETPFLSVAAAGDRYFAPPRACEQLVRAAGSARKELLVCDGLSHRGLVRGAHARERTWPRIAHWIEETVEGR